MTKEPVFSDPAGLMPELLRESFMSPGGGTDQLHVVVSVETKVIFSPTAREHIAKTHCSPAVKI